MSAVQTRAPWEAWGLSVSRVERPRTAEDVAAILAECAKERIGVLPVGAGTALAAGGAPGAGSVALPLDALDGIVEYAPDDLTLTARAGTPLDTIRETILARGQRLPGVAGGPGTLGGILASGWTASTSREAQGALRERLLGAQIAGPQGKLTRAGGRVVKNVTGYDVHRMHVGAGGAFGVFTELSIRLEPLPEKRAEATVEVPGWEEAQSAWLWLRREGPEVASLEVLAEEGGMPKLVAWLEGDTEPTASATAALAAGWGRVGRVATRDLDARAVQTGASPAPAPPGSARLTITLRVTPSGAIPAFERARREVRDAGLTLDAACFPNSGDIHFQLHGRPEALEAWLGTCASAVRDGGLAYRVEDEMLPLSTDLPRWSADPAALRMTARVKRALDPEGVLRPGSYSVDALERAALFFSGSGGRS